MEYVSLADTGLRVSRIGLGTWQFSDAWGVKNYDTAKKLIEKAVEMGINLFDTAMVYGNGLSEEFLGRALHEIGVKREEIVIATKIPGDYLNPWDIFRSVRRSLKRLQTNYIDILQLHWPPCWHNFPTCKYMRALERLVKLGLVNHIGVSNYPVRLIDEVRGCLSTIDIVSMQYRYNIIERQAEEELIPYAEENDLIFLAWSPLAKGAVTGKYSLENISSFNDLRRTDPVFHPENFRKISPVISKLVELAEKYGKTPAQIALNWIIMYSDNVIPIPGAKKPEHVVQNAESVGWRMNIHDWLELEKLTRNINIMYSVYY